MTLVEFLCLFLAMSGITFTIVHSKIMDIIGLRQWWSKFPFFRDLFHCSFCTSFHIGYTYGIFCFLVKLVSVNLFYALTIPFAACAFVFLWDRIVITLDK